MQRHNDTHCYTRTQILQTQTLTCIAVDKYMYGKALNTKIVTFTYHNDPIKHDSYHNIHHYNIVADERISCDATSALLAK